MSAGMLTLTNNSDLVSGVGTSFSTEITVGDFIVVTVGGVPYTLPVKSVESDTELALVSVFSGPTQSGAAWSAVPRVALNMVTAALVAQSAEALRGLNYDKKNWQQFFTADGDVTITLPDTSQTTGPSAKKLINSVDGKADKTALDSKADKTALDSKADKVDGAVPVNQGGTGAGTADKARQNFGLKEAALRDLSTDLILEGYQQNAKVTLQTYRDFRPHVSYNNPITFPEGLTSGIINGNQLPGSGTTSSHIAGLLNSRSYPDSSGVTTCFQIGVSDLIAGFRRTNSNGFYSNFYNWWHWGNTTTDANGFIKSASPIVKIFGDGRYETNEESEGAIVTRIDIGKYVIEGCTGLNSDAGWGGVDGGFEIPVTKNKQPKIWIDYEVNADGAVLVKTYHRTYPNAPEFARNEIDGKSNGEPIDIPSDSFVSVRVEMPPNSIWNQRQADVQQ
ncbi:TPA: phage tail protein [Citrobacter amalonaticus]